MAVVQPAPDSSISEVICTNLDYAQYSCGLCCKNRMLGGDWTDGTMTDFKWRHFQGDVILWAVRWYCRYPISYRDLGVASENGK